MTSRGPIIRILELGSAFAGLVAIGALIFSLAAFNARLDGIQVARQKAAVDSCTILQRLIVDSGNLTHHPTQAHEFLMEVGLTDCDRYARSVVAGTVRLPGPPRPGERR